MTEREAFESWFSQEFRCDEWEYNPFSRMEFNGIDAYSCSTVNTTWSAWQAAKAQAVPEGFVLVSVDTLEECLDWAHIAKWDSPSDEVDKKIAHHEALIESAISAQEQSND